MFSATYPGLHDPHQTDGFLLLVVTGAHVFRLRRADQGERIVAEHSSPGTGTRAASLDLRELAPCEKLEVTLTWSPAEVRLHLFDRSTRQLLQSVAAPAEFDLWVDESGNVVQVGAANIEVMNARVYAGGKELLSPPARRSWAETKSACNILLSARGSEPEAYLRNVITANASLSILVTGFEVYSKKRFQEVAAEGVPPDLSALVRAFGSREERDQLSSGATPAVLATDSALDDVLEWINFQSYDRAKRAWNRGYGIVFGDDLGVSSSLLERLQRLLEYRHRIVHVSPMLGMLNGPQVPPEEPEFPGFEFASKAILLMDEFVTALHGATLRLRPAAGVDPTGM